jgi:glycerate-2-kinase
MIIKNFEFLATNKLRKDALEIAEAAFESIDTETVIRESVKVTNGVLEIKGRQFNLKKFEHIYLIGVGKAAFAAGKTLEKILGNYITRGIVLDIQGGKMKKLKSLIGTHPLASQKNVSATKEIISLLKKAGRDDLILAVISGGSSALLCAPHKITYEKISEIFEVMTDAGATIEEINIVRKHLSEINGGDLANLTYPATIVSLIFSDVPGDDLSTIGSGPTVLDSSTKEETQALIEKYNVLKGAKLSKLELTETPKNPIYFENVTNIIVVNNKRSVDAMAKKAAELNYKVSILSTQVQGEASNVGKKLLASAEYKTAVLAAGETTVSIKGNGIGGRNQHLVLSALKRLKKDQVIISADSDGVDHGHFAGAIGDKETVAKAVKKHLPINQFLNNCDSFNFFRLVGDGIETGPLESNVSDFMLVLAD